MGVPIFPITFALNTIGGSTVPANTVPMDKPRFMGESYSIVGWSYSCVEASRGPGAGTPRLEVVKVDSTGTVTQLFTILASLTNFAGQVDFDGLYGAHSVGATWTGYPPQPKVDIADDEAVYVRYNSSGWNGDRVMLGGDITLWAIVGTPTVQTPSLPDVPPEAFPLTFNMHEVGVNALYSAPYSWPPDSPVFNLGNINYDKYRTIDDEFQCIGISVTADTEYFGDVHLEVLHGELGLEANTQLAEFSIESQGVPGVYKWIDVDATLPANTYFRLKMREEFLWHQAFAQNVSVTLWMRTYAEPPIPTGPSISWQHAIKLLDTSGELLGYGLDGYGEEGYGSAEGEGEQRDPRWSTARLRRWVRETFLNPPEE